MLEKGEKQGPFIAGYICSGATAILLITCCEAQLILNILDNKKDLSE